MNTLYYGDNLDVLRRHIKDETVDLIYLDPPFKSNQDYNVLFKEESGERAAAQILAFEDTWHWDEAASRAYEETVLAGGKVADVMRAFQTFLGGNDMLAYLAMMAPRLVELRRVLKSTGSIYLHCDPTASHYLKLLMDAVFGVVNFRSEVIWKRTSAHSSSKRYGPVHDTILFYSRTDGFVWTYPKIEHSTEYIDTFFRYTEKETGRKFSAGDLTGAGVRHGDSGKAWRGVNPTEKGRHWALRGDVTQKLNIDPNLTTQEQLDALDSAGRIYWPGKKDGMPRLKWFQDELEGASVPDNWTDIPPIGAKAKERLGYPTQKPEALLERIIKASSNEGDVVLDPFCGCGTAVAVAQKLNRQWIGIDITHLAITLIKKRLKDSFGAERSPLSSPQKEDRSGGKGKKDSGGEPQSLNPRSAKSTGRVRAPATAEDVRAPASEEDGQPHGAVPTVTNRVAEEDGQPHGVVPTLTYRVIGEPTALEDARQLAEDDKYQFQWWALGLVDARPVEQKKGADQGIDGRRYFIDGKNRRTEQVIFSVKGGHVTASQLRDLRGVVEREKAAVGVMIALEEPTKPMKKEAADAGFYHSDYQNTKHPRIQILTIEELLEGAKVDLPVLAFMPSQDATFKKAPKSKAKKKGNEELEL